MRFTQEISIFKPHAIEYAVTSLGTRITQTAEEIRLEAAQTLSNYSTTIQMNSAISQKADQITLEVSQTYATQSSQTAAVNSLSSRITQNASSITSEVEARQNGDSSLSSRISQTAHTITLGVSGKAGKTSGASITISLKDANGNIISSGSGNVLIDGNVIFSSQLTDGTTTISGSNIKTGTINANLVSVTNINASNITSGTLTGREISGGSIIQTVSGAGTGGYGGNANGTQASIQNGIVKAGQFSISTNTSGTEQIDIVPEGDDDAGGYNGILVKGHISTYGCLWAGQYATDEFRINCRGYLWTKDSNIPSSDGRLKKDVETISYDESAKYIFGLRPVRFRWKDATKQIAHHGFIAQEAQKLVSDDWGLVMPGPEMSPDGDPYLGIAYTELIADLVTVIQNQEKRITVLERRNNG